MAIGVLVLGESGTGKTFSISSFKENEVKILSVAKQILSFRGKYEIVKTPTADDVIREMRNTSKKNIVIDDFQYILGLPMMRRIGEKGWDKFNDISQPYADVLDAINGLPDDTIVYFLSHTETAEDGKTKIKTIGKALDKYITIEGLFMIVLGTHVIDQKYFFTTQNNGNNTVKTPYGMFDNMYIPNDLKYVEDKIRNYYYMDGAKSDEEIAAEDEEHAVSEEDTKRQSRRSKREKPDEVKTERESSEEIQKRIDEAGEEEKPKRRSRRSEKPAEAETVTEEVEDVTDDDVPFEESGAEPKRRKRRER